MLEFLLPVNNILKTGGHKGKQLKADAECSTTLIQTSVILDPPTDSNVLYENPNLNDSQYATFKCKKFIKQSQSGTRHKVTVYFEMQGTKIKNKQIDYTCGYQCAYVIGSNFVPNHITNLVRHIDIDNELYGLEEIDLLEPLA